MQKSRYETIWSFKFVDRMSFAKALALSIVQLQKLKELRASEQVRKNENCPGEDIRVTDLVWNRKLGRKVR
jgi:hypothetical protein